jgi:hypothetical protein
MRRFHLRLVAASLTGLVVAAVLLGWLAALAGFGKETTLPFGWGVVFGGIAVLVGSGAGLFVYAVTARRP